MRVRLIGWFLLAALLAPTFAAAQTVTNPVVGSYESIYVLSGRVIDVDGAPAAGAVVSIDVEGRGLKGEPFRAKANCFGDFIATFTIGFIDPTAEVTVRLEGASKNVTPVQTTVKLDPFYRRSDVALQTPSFWPSECPDQTQNWPGRISITGRVLNRTAEYTANETTFHAKPYHGTVLVWFIDEDGFRFCPPSARGNCEYITTDARGDFRYSWTFPEPKTALGRFEVEVLGKTYNGTLDPEFRNGAVYIETTGQGAPRVETPGPSLVMLVGLLAFVAISRSVLARQRR